MVSMRLRAPLEGMRPSLVILNVSDLALTLALTLLYTSGVTPGTLRSAAVFGKEPADCR